MGGWGAVAEGTREKRWRDAMAMWAGAVEPTNKEWEVYQDVNTSPAPPPTPPPSPLSDIVELSSLSSDSSSPPSLLFARFEVSDIEG